MTNMVSAAHDQRRWCQLLLFTAALAFAGARAMSADEVPSLKPGMWSFVINVETPGSTPPHTQNLRRCANPSEDIRKKWQALAAGTCKFSPMRHEGKLYSYSSSCEKGGIRLIMKSVITVENDQSYRVATESQTNNQLRRESIVAKREGDCPGANGHPPVPQPSKVSPAGG